MEGKLMGWDVEAYLEKGFCVGFQWQWWDNYRFVLIHLGPFAIAFRRLVGRVYPTPR